MYPAPPCVTFGQFLAFYFPLRRIGQPVSPHSFVSAGDFLHGMLSMGIPHCSDSAAMFLHILADAPFAVARQNIGNVLCASPLYLFVYHVFSFISFAFLRSSHFHSFSLWSGLFLVLSCSNLLSQFNLNLSLYPDCFILWLNLDNSCAVSSMV